VENISLLNVTLLLALSQGLFVTLYFGIYTLDSSQGRWFFFTWMSACSYLVLALGYISATETPTDYFLSLLLNLSMAFFPLGNCICTLYLFDDDRKPAPALLAAGLVVISLHMIGLGLESTGSTLSQVQIVLLHLPWQAFFLFSGLLCLFIALRGARTDLIESRRRLRLFLLTSLGSYLILIIGMQWVFNRNVPESVSMFYLLLLYFGYPLILFRLDNSLISEPFQTKRYREPSLAKGQETRVLIEEIRLQMEQQRSYRNPGFTIRDLSTSLKAPEYKLRQVINQQMGFRNFNHYLNKYRIEEAEQRLLQEDVKVLTISLDVGYKSLSSFNRIFRQVHGMTPTEFRSLRHKFVDT
jgi:AraC-like DNA-binding protein